LRAIYDHHRACERGRQLRDEQRGRLLRAGEGCYAPEKKLVMLALTHADEKANAHSALKNIRKIHLTRISVRTLLFCCRAAAIAFAPSTPTWLPPCKTHVGPPA
jgi:hypothetical protein